MRNDRNLWKYAVITIADDFRMIQVRDNKVMPMPDMQDSSWRYTWACTRPDLNPLVKITENMYSRIDPRDSFSGNMRRDNIGDPAINPLTRRIFPYNPSLTTTNPLIHLPSSTTSRNKPSFPIANPIQKPIPRSKPTADDIKRKKEEEAKERKRRIEAEDELSAELFIVQHDLPRVSNMADFDIESTQYTSEHQQQMRWNQEAMDRGPPTSEKATQPSYPPIQPRSLSPGHNRQLDRRDPSRQPGDSSDQADQHIDRRQRIATPTSSLNLSPPQRDSIRSPNSYDPTRQQTYRVLNVNDQIRISVWTYEQITAARNYWEREKTDSSDMRLLIQLIATECLNDVSSMIYSYFIERGDEEEAMLAEEWRSRYSPNQLWEMFLSQITAGVEDVNNIDNDLSTRLLLLTS